MTSNEPAELTLALQRAIDLFHAGHRAEAAGVLAPMGRKFPRSAKLWGYLGLLYLEQGCTTPAARCFRRAVELSPRSENASLGLFHSLWQAGRTNKAFDEMRRFVRAGEPHEYLTLLRDMLTEGSAAADQRLLGAHELREAQRAYRRLFEGREQTVPPEDSQIVELAHA